QLLGTVMAVRWWLRVRGLLIGAQSRGEPVPVRVVEHHFDRRHSGWHHGNRHHGDQRHGDQRQPVQAGPGQVHADRPAAHDGQAYRPAGHNTERVSSREARGAVSAARRTG
ncbi:MAG TPA: hypothetical protein VHT94_00905, partial [Streptosporangiaceae bacterium]|nr:hypothetical protein [Streptosporangiaceae bacterium]